MLQPTPGVVPQVWPIDSPDRNKSHVQPTNITYNTDACQAAFSPPLCTSLRPYIRLVEAVCVKPSSSAPTIDVEAAGSMVSIIEAQRDSMSREEWTNVVYGLMLLQSCWAPFVRSREATFVYPI